MITAHDDVDDITDGVVVGRVPGIHYSWVHQPHVSVGLHPQLLQLLLGCEVPHVVHVHEVVIGNHHWSLARLGTVEDY